MLRQMSSEEGQARVEPVPAAEAAKVRVTPEELVQAMAAIEARREQEARERDGTIAIGDAVQELGLNATPEEILAAVQVQRDLQAQRERQVQRDRQVQPVAPRRPYRLRRAMLTAVALTLGLFVARSSVTVAVAPPATATPATVIETLPAEPGVPAVFIDADGDGRIDAAPPPTSPNILPAPPAPGR